MLNMKKIKLILILLLSLGVMSSCNNKFKKYGCNIYADSKPKLKYK
jgi:hypothetical protein